MLTLTKKKPKSKHELTACDLAHSILDKFIGKKVFYFKLGAIYSFLKRDYITDLEQIIKVIEITRENLRLFAMTDEINNPLFKLALDGRYSTLLNLNGHFKTEYYPNTIIWNDQFRNYTYLSCDKCHIKNMMKKFVIDSIKDANLIGVNESRIYRNYQCILDYLKNTTIDE